MPTREVRIGSMSLGLVLPTFPQNATEPWQQLGKVATGAEQAGASGLWVCDHLFWPTPNLDCGVALTIAAAATEQCTVGTAVVQIPLRQPASVAKMASSVHLLSGGRVVLGVGVGEHPGEYEVAGVPFARRGRALDDAISQLRRWWRTDHTERYGMLPSPEHMPVWVGGRSDAARRRAATLGDGWMPLFLSPDRLREGFEHMAKEAEATGRSARDVVRSAMVFVDCDTGTSKGAGVGGPGWLASLYGLPPDRFSRHIVAGPPARCADMLAAYAEAGTEHLALFITSDDPLPQFEAIVGELAYRG